MEKSKIILGYCPTRRDVFDVNVAIEYGKRIKEYIKRFDVEVVDIDGINDENLLFEDRDIEAVIARFKEKISTRFSLHIAISVLKTALRRLQRRLASLFFFEGRAMTSWMQKQDSDSAIHSTDSLQQARFSVATE